MQQRPVEQFSGGWRMRVSLARYCLVDASVYMRKIPVWDCVIGVLFDQVGPLQNFHSPVKAFTLRSDQP